MAQCPRHGESRPLRHAAFLLALLTLLSAALSADTSTTSHHKKKKPATVAASPAHPATTRKTGPNLTAHARTVSTHAHLSAHHAAINPVLRLQTISQLASALSRGTSALNYPSALDNFYSSLAAHQQEPDNSIVRVLQFGDSHTAADMFTGQMRHDVQLQFGDGGIGYSYAGHPFAGYRILGSERSQSAGWTTLGTHFGDLGDTLLGMGGVALSTSRAGEFVTLDVPCSTLDIQYLLQPGGGDLQLTDNGGTLPDISTDSPTYAPGTFHYECPDVSGVEADHHFVLTTMSDAPVRLFGIVALQPGITWESIGINGAEAPLLLRWDPSLFTSYLHDSQPNLIVLAYGTNEAAAPHWDYDSYSEAFARLIDTIHKAAPQASILVAGPTDRATAVRRRGYVAFPGTERILNAQRDVCRTHGCAFWDQQKRMGGYGSMRSWVNAGWAQPDHTHLTGEGYRALADTLAADLLAGYDQYRTAHGLQLNPIISQLQDPGRNR